MKLPAPTVLLAAAVLGSSCGRRDAEPRIYSEPAPAAPPPAAMAPAAAMPEGNVPMPPAAEAAWTVPGGWTVRPAEGMRRATFVFEEAGQPYECALTSLAGEAGGVPANVIRWAGQIGLAVPQEKLRAFVDALPERKTAAGHPLWIADLTALDDGRAPDAPQMIAAIVRRPADTLFLKLTAPKPVIESRRAAFEALAASLR
jgi:hypothetical protein